MKYENANNVLPSELISQIQKYAAGKLLYIPKKEEQVAWGSLSGGRQRLQKRNQRIYDEYKNGKGVLLATLSDVAYGMDNVYALEDISSIIKYIDYPLTSNDVGYRKPCANGLKLLAEKMRIDMKEMAFVGDEEKDVLCAANAGAYSILINRDGSVRNFGQNKEIDSLDKLLEMFG